MAWTTFGSAAGLRAAAASLLLPAVLWAQPPLEQADVRTRFQAGQAALQAGRFAQAETEFGAALASEPGLSEARVNLGLALFLQGKYQRSVHELEEAAHALPDLPAAHLFLGLGHLKLGASDRAIAALSRSLELDPASLEAHRALAACHLAKGDYASAVQEFQAAFSHGPDRTEAWYLLGRDYMGLMSDLAGRLVVEQPDSVLGRPARGGHAGAQRGLGGRRELLRDRGCQAVRPAWSALCLGSRPLAARAVGRSIR